MRTLYFCPVVSSSIFFLSSPNLSGPRVDVYHTSTHGVALVRIYNAGMKCAARTRLAGNRGRKKWPKCHLVTIAQLCPAVFSQLRLVSTIGKNLLKNIQQYLLHPSSQYGERRLTNGWDRFTSLGHPSKYQRVSSIGLVTAAMSLTGGQPNFARCLAVSGLLYYVHIFGGCCLLMEFCQVQNSRYVQVLRSHVLEALLHGTPTLGSAKLCAVVQGMELRYFRRGRHV